MWDVRIVWGERGVEGVRVCRGIRAGKKRRRISVEDVSPLPAHRVRESGSGSRKLVPCGSKEESGFEHDRRPVSGE